MMQAARYSDPGGISVVESVMHSENIQQESRFELFAQKMRSAEMPELVIDIFHRYYDQLTAGATGYIDSQEAGPVDYLPDYEELDEGHDQAGIEALDRTIVVKLNGGLGTSMGMTGPKSLVTVKDDLSFLDIVIRQVMHLRQETGVRLPLVLMNSFNTHADTLTALQAYPDFVQDIPIDFVQHMKPKIWQDTLTPVSWPADPEKEWCPPGHGDIYVALATSGMLEKMLAAGYEYLFVSNSDNLGAVLDLKILGYIATKQLPFLMEVAYRTAADKKGGFVYLDGGNSQVENNVLVSVDTTTTLGNGQWTLRLIVVDQTGNFPSPCQVTISVQN